MSELSDVLAWSTVFWTVMITASHGIRRKCYNGDEPPVLPALFWLGVIALTTTYPSLFMLEGSVAEFTTALVLPLAISTAGFTVYMIVINYPKRHLIAQSIAESALFNNDKQIKRRCLELVEEARGVWPANHEMQKLLDDCAERVPRLVDRRREEKARIARLKSRSRNDTGYEKLLKGLDNNQGMDLPEDVKTEQLLNQAQEKHDILDAKLDTIRDYLMNARDIAGVAEDEGAETLEEFVTMMKGTYEMTREAGREQRSLARESYEATGRDRNLDLFNELNDGSEAFADCEEESETYVAFDDKDFADDTDEESSQEAEDAPCHKTQAVIVDG